MTLQILSGGELVYEPWPWAGDWHMFSGNVDDFRYPDTPYLDPLYVWRTQRSVRTVVRFLARSFAQVRLLGYEFVDVPAVEDSPARRDRRRVDDDHPLAVTLSEPAGEVTEYDFAFAQEVDLCLYERWAAFKQRDRNDRISLMRMPPRRWRFIRDNADLPVAVKWFDPSKPSGDFIEIPLDRLVWLDGYPATDSTHASPMQYLSDLLVEETESARSRTELWRNGARISGVIERPVDAPDWKPTGRRKFAEAWRGAYRRGGTSEGGTPVLEDGMTYKPVTMVTPEQGQQVESRQLAMAEVSSAFGVAPELVGAREGTLSNVQAYRELLYTETLGPMFMQSRQAYQRRLVPDYGDSALFVEHNVAEKLRMSFEEQARIGQTAVGGPVMTRNEWRQRMNLEAIQGQGADDLIVPLNVLTGDQASPTDSRPDLTGAVTPRAIPANPVPAALSSNGDG